MRFHNPLKRPKIRIRRPRIRIRWRKNSSWWAVGVAVAFFVSLFALHVVLMQHAESIIRGVLDSRVRQATEGFYSTSFEHIGVSYTDKSVTIHNLHLYPDSSRLTNKQGRQITPSNVYDILIPELRIEGIELKKAYLDKELKLDRLSIIHPEIKLYVNFDISPTATDSLKQDINERLAPFFRIIEAEKIQVLQGGLILHTQKNKRKSRIKASFNFDASKLLVKTALRPQDEDWMQLERFIVQAGALEGSIADDTYLLRLKSITASSADSSFFLQGLQLLPTADVSTLLERKPDLERIYTIAIPQLYTYGLNYSALYNLKNFSANEITLLSPSLEMFDAKLKEEGEKENFKPEDLYPVIEKVLNRVAVERLFIRHGKSLVRNREEDYLTNLQMSIREAAVFNFELDSAAVHQTNKLFFADSVRLHLRDYHLRLSDQAHLLKADELLVNSNTENATAINLRIEPDTVKALRIKGPALFTAVVPTLEVRGIDLLQLYNNNRLIIDSLLVDEPDIQYTQQAKRQKVEKKEERAFKQEDLYGLISDYLYQLNINQLAIRGGAISVSRTIEDSVEIFNTRIQHAFLWNLQIDSTSAYQLNKLFYADNFDVQIADYRHKLPDGVHAIEAKTIGVSTLKDRISLKGIRVYNLPGYIYPFSQIKNFSHPSLINVEIPYIDLNGVDILKSYLTKRLEVQEVVIPNPVVHIASRINRKDKEKSGIIHSRTLYNIIEDFAEVVSVKSLRLTNAEILTAFYVPNGLLQLNSPSASVAIDNFRFDAYTSYNPKRLFFADAVSVSAQDFIADLPDERYQILADLLEASTAGQNIKAMGVRLQQPASMMNEEDLILKGKKGILSFILPSVHINGLDFDRAYYAEQLHVDSIIAQSPTLTYQMFPPNGKKNKKEKTLIPQLSLYESIAPFFQSLSVGTVQLEDGVIRTLTRKQGEVQQQLLLDNITIGVNNFLLDSLATSNEQRFFYSEDIRVHIGEYRWFLPDNVHQITAGNLDLSTRNNLIRASSVKLAPVPGINLALNKTPNRYNVKVPEVMLVGIPFDDIFEKEEFRLKRLDILNPDIEVRQYGNGKGNATDQKAKAQRSLPELLSAGLNLLQIDEAVLSGGSLRYINYGDEKTQELNFPHVEATVTNFSITPQTRTKATRPFFADNLELRLDGWKRLLPDSIHWLEAGTIRFSAKDSLLLAHDLKVYPDESRLSTTTGQLLNAKVPTVRLEGFAYPKLSDDTLLISHLWLLNPSLNMLQPGIKSNNKKQEAKAEKLENKLLGLVRIDSISVVDGAFIMRKLTEQDTSRLELNSIYVKAAGFHYDSVQQQNKERILYTDNLEVGLKNYKAFLSGGYYEIEAKEIGLSTARQQLWADSLRITPALDRDGFAMQKGVEVDQFTFRNKRILVDQLDIRKLIHEKTIEADKLSIDGFNLYIYRDKRQPYPVKKRPLMPQDALRNSNWNILIRETELKDGYLAYAEQVKGAREEGFIDLTNLYMHADTISNYPNILDSGYVTNISTNFDLMGKGHLKAFFEIPMGDTTNQHMFYGSLDQMELDNFNPLLEKTVFVSIRSGHVDRIEFKVIADADGAEGAMEFEYDNLRVALVNKKTGKPGGVLRQMASSVANMFVHSSNTVNGKQESLRRGEIELERDEKRSVVNYWVKTLIEGFKDSIGI